MTTSTALHHSIDVAVEPAKAFDVFTRRLGDWWPKAHNLLDEDLVERTMEPRVGGRIVDTGARGGECSWGRVLAYDPPDRVVFSWDIGPTWTIETDPSRCSEVEVTFTPTADGGTRVELEHRHLDRHADGWEGLHAALDSDGGWPGVLRAYETLAD